MRNKAAHERRMRQQQITGFPEWAGPKHSTDIEDFRAEVDAAMEEHRKGVEEYRRQREDVRLQRILRFKLTLPAHSHAWFDALSIDDQFRLTQPIGGSSADTQADYDATDSHRGWPEV